MASSNSSSTNCLQFLEQAETLKISMYLQSQSKNAQFQPIAIMQDKTVAVALPNYARKSIREQKYCSVYRRLQGHFRQMGQGDEVQHFSFLFNSPISGNLRKTSTILLSRSGTLKKQTKRKKGIYSPGLYTLLDAGLRVHSGHWGISGSPTKEFSSMEVGATIVHTTCVRKKKKGKTPHHPSKYINEKKYKAAT